MAHRLTTIVILSFVLFGAPDSARSQTDAAATLNHIANAYTLTPNITYRTVSNWEAKLDVIQPRGLTAPNPTLIYFHGGGWTAGTKESVTLVFLPYLEMGWTVVNVEYRLTDVALAPAAVEDSRCALRWVYKNAKQYNFDLTKIVTTGTSAGGHLALYDRRHGPSPRKAPAPEVERVLWLYRERYSGWNVRHFHRFARRAHGVTLSYSFVKLALQEAGLVRKGRARGRHRRRRPPRACFGELLHVDGSNHPWLTLRPDERQTLIAVIDDATKRLLYAQLWPSESTEAILSALRAVAESAGLPMALYTDRASWAFYTRRAGERVDRTRLTQVGRALHQLGIEHTLIRRWGE